MALLTDLKARKMLPSAKPFAHGQVPGLRLEPGAKKGEGKWVLRFVSPVTGKRRDMGLGRYPDVGISAARVKGLAAREIIADGNDPIDARIVVRVEIKARAQALTFEDAACKVHGELKPAWRNDKHADQWINTLRDYAFPQIGSRKVYELAPADFADVLRPIWLSKAETAGRVKQRCETVMQWCWAHGLVAANPVAVVDHLLPHQPPKRERVRHQPAMPWSDLPNFVRTTVRSEVPSSTRSLLEFIILTAARSGEARAARWDELDLEARIWTVPASRMKTKVAHRVPLSDRAIEILTCQRKYYPDAEIVFPAPRGGVLSDMTLTAFLRRYKAKSSEAARFATAHGFRSSFRDWAAEHGYSRETAERALAHTVASKVEAAYNRTDLLEQRRIMMAGWSAFVEGAGDRQKVVPIQSARKTRA